MEVQGKWVTMEVLDIAGIGGVQAEGDVDWEVGNLLRWE